MADNVLLCKLTFPVISRVACLGLLSVHTPLSRSQSPPPVLFVWLRLPHPVRPRWGLPLFACFALQCPPHPPPLLRPPFCSCCLPFLFHLGFLFWCAFHWLLSWGAPGGSRASFNLRAFRYAGWFDNGADFCAHILKKHFADPHVRDSGF